MSIARLTWCRGLLLCLLVLAGAMIVPPARAQWAQRDRLVHLFDFEERERNPESLPMYWYPIGRRQGIARATFDQIPLHASLINQFGFPASNEVRFDTTQHARGKYSFYLGMEGGSTGAYLEVGAMTAIPRSDYLVTAKVRTTDLKYAKARLVTYFVDARGRLIGDSVSFSEPVRTAGKWQVVSAPLYGDFAQASWIGIELQLLQPVDDPDSPLGGEQIVLQEVKGGAWFDDVAVWQLPYVNVTTQSQVNLIKAPQKPSLEMEVRDLTGRAMVAEARVYDHDLKEVARIAQPVDGQVSSGWSWTPPLKKYGWYIVDLQIHEPDEAGAFSEPIGRTLTAFAWLPEDAALPREDATRFKLVAENMRHSHVPYVSQMMEATGLRAVVLNAWMPSMTEAGMEDSQQALDDLMQDIAYRGREVTLALAPAPKAMIEGTGLEELATLPIFRKPESFWEPFAAPVLLRHGQRIRQWQLGTLAQSGRQATMANLPELIEQARQGIAGLAPTPTLVIPWRLDQTRPIGVTRPVTFHLDAPDDVRPDMLESFLSGWKPPDVWVHLRLPRADRLTQQRRMDQLAKSTIHAWRVNAGAITIGDPWAMSSTRNLTYMPDPAIAVFGNLAHRLAGRRVVGELDLGEGLKCLILDGSAGGMLIAWNESADEDHAVINMQFGGMPVAIDIWGNRTPLHQVNGQHQLSLTQSPTFIEGIDPRLALFRASFELDPKFIESTQKLHQHTIRFRNPWPRVLNGKFDIVDPQEWNINPRGARFSVAPGDTAEIPISLSFPLSEVTGYKRLVARFELAADTAYQIEVATPLELGLDDVEFEASMFLEVDEKTGRVDAVVSQQIVNKGTEPKSLYAFASSKGHQRQEKIISRLKPGRTDMRIFRIKDVRDVNNLVVHVGLRETNGPAVLNKSLSAQDP
jgi:hypothetical protein